MNYTVFQRIEDAYYGLSKSHKKIADYILENYEKAAFLTAAKLGETTGISVSTVVGSPTPLAMGLPESQDARGDHQGSRVHSTHEWSPAIDQETTLTSVLQKDRETIPTP